MGKKKVLNKQKIKNRTLVLSQKPSLSIHSELRQQNRAKRRRLKRPSRRRSYWLSVFIRCLS